MGRIHVLDKQIAELIAAGEVVERPSSVIKELVENSLDAGANLITVEIQHGGITYIRVSDNGCGIAPDDIPLVFQRHATSKIRDEGDLDCISTLGFRGEAMASIAAVSRVELMTRTPDSDEGSYFEIHGGEVQDQSSIGCPVGTTLIARDLFYNTPARMKFLKKDTSEANSVSSVVEKAALSHPEVSFKLIRDGQVKLHTPGDGNMLSAIHAIWGREAASAMIPVNYEGFGLRVEGYICKPVNSRGNRTLQNFFINSRFIKSKTMMAALEEGYKHSIMVGKFPSCVLNLIIPYEETDVNVHPAKIEVRFANEKSVFDVVYYGVKSALRQYDDSIHLEEQTKLPQGETESAQFRHTAEKELPSRMTAEEYRKMIGSDGKTSEKGAIRVSSDKVPQQKNNYTNSANIYTEVSKPRVNLNLCNTDKTISSSEEEKSDQLQMADGGMPYTVSRTANPQPVPFPVWEEALPDCMNGKKAESEPEQEMEPVSVVYSEPASQEKEAPQHIEGLIFPDEEPDQFAAVRMIGEAFGTYIILENKDELILIDKHAAHERLLYEQLKKIDITKDSQMLLVPVLVHLSREDYNAVAGKTEIFEKIGFGVSDFGEGDLSVRSVPVALPECDIRDVIEETAHKVSLNHLDLTPDIIDNLLHNIACRSAIKAHDKTVPIELSQIIEMLRENDQVRYCPHGRPIARVLTRRDLEKMFGRIQ